MVCMMAEQFRGPIGCRIDVDKDLQVGDRFTELEKIFYLGFNDMLLIVGAEADRECRGFGAGIGDGS